MAREYVAYIIIVLLIACGAVAAVLSRRFARYQASLRRGDHRAKRTRKPFWMP
jgi:hypothetical protein